MFGILITFIIVNHYWCKVWRATEQVIANSVERTANAVMVDVTDKLGLETKKEPLPEMGLVAMVEEESLLQGVNPIYPRAILQIESGKRAYAISSAGAIGPLQIMPANYKRCKLAHPGKLFDERLNVKCGVQIWKEELLTYQGNPILAAKAYNGGPKCVRGGCSESEAYWVNMLKHVAKETPALG